MPHAHHAGGRAARGTASRTACATASWAGWISCSCGPMTRSVSSNPSARRARGRAAAAPRPGRRPNSAPPAARGRPARTRRTPSRRKLATTAGLLGGPAQATRGDGHPSTGHGQTQECARSADALVVRMRRHMQDPEHRRRVTRRPRRDLGHCLSRMRECLLIAGRRWGHGFLRLERRLRATRETSCERIRCRRSPDSTPARRPRSTNCSRRCRTGCAAGSTARPRDRSRSRRPAPGGAAEPAATQCGDRAAQSGSPDMAERPHRVDGGRPPAAAWA